MQTLGQRIQELRKQKGLTQQDFAGKVSISHPQIVRYETKDVQPPADVLKRIADELGVSIDYLVNGNTDEKAQASINDTRLLQMFRAVEQMEDKDKKIVEELISAFIFQRETKQRIAL